MWRNDEHQVLVYEGASAFWLVDLATNREYCMGDGVDWLFDQDDHALGVGTDEFYAALAQLVEQDGEELRDAYCD